MTEVTKHEPGSFSWAELATSDPQGRQEVLHGPVRLEHQGQPDGRPDFVYTLLQIGGKDVAALYKMMKEQAEQGVPPNWMCYVAVENADETAKKAKTLGGTVIAEPFDVMDYGRMAVIQDPEGAIFSIWQPHHAHRACSASRSPARCAGASCRRGTRPSRASSTRASSAGA